MTETLEQPVAYVPAEDAQGVFNKMSEALQAAGHATPTAWINGFMSQYGAQVQNEPPTVARFAANSYWCYVLGLHAAKTGEDTTNARFCLEDRCEEKEWYDLVVKVVAPAIVKFGL